MQTFSKDTNNDLYLDKYGNISISTDLQACIEACENAVSTMLGEQIYQTNEGVPNFSLLWNGVPNYAQAEIAIRNVIESVDNVIEVISFDYVANSNIFSYNATIRTNFGIGKVYNGL